MERTNPTVKSYLEAIGENLEKIKPEDPVTAHALAEIKDDLANLCALIGFSICPGPGLLRRY
jgi:hypothetical protein